MEDLLNNIYIPTGNTAEDYINQVRVSGKVNRNRLAPVPDRFAPGKLGCSLPFGDDGWRGLLLHSKFVCYTKTNNPVQRYQKLL